MKVGVVLFPRDILPNLAYFCVVFMRCYSKRQARDRFFYTFPLRLPSFSLPTIRSCPTPSHSDHTSSHSFRMSSSTPPHLRCNSYLSPASTACVFSPFPFLCRFESHCRAVAEMFFSRYTTSRKPLALNPPSPFSRTSVQPFCLYLARALSLSIPTSLLIIVDHRESHHAKGHCRPDPKNLPYFNQCRIASHKLSIFLSP